MPPTGPPISLDVARKQGQATLVWAVGAYCVFMWEWIICLPQEYKRVWTRKITFASVLYALNRYFGILQLSFVMSLLSGVWSEKACKYVYWWEPFGALISTVLSQTILGFRCYALFAQNKAVGLILWTILLMQICIGGIAVSMTPPRTLVPGAFQTPCAAAVRSPGWLISSWTIPLLFDSTAFLLTAYKTYGYWRKNVTIPLMSVIWRDGVFYFFVIFSMNFANIVILLAAPKILRAVNLMPTIALEVALSCRLLLNTRDALAKSYHLKSNSNSTSNTNPAPSKDVTDSTKIKDDYLQRNDRAPPSPRLYSAGQSERDDIPSTSVMKLEPNRYHSVTDKPSELPPSVCRESRCRIGVYLCASWILTDAFNKQ